jgi:hypothetical protein
MHFLARMSHEIRTPLNGLIGLLDLVALDETDATRRARLQAALTSARDLQALTKDILAFSAGQDDRAEVRRGGAAALPWPYVCPRRPRQVRRHLPTGLPAPACACWWSTTTR